MNTSQGNSQGGIPWPDSPHNCCHNYGTCPDPCVVPDEPTPPKDGQRAPTDLLTLLAECRDTIMQCCTVSDRSEHGAFMARIEAALAVSTTAAADARDAERYRKVRRYIGAARLSDYKPHWTLFGIPVTEGVMQGSVAQHFDTAVDGLSSINGGR